MDELEMVEFEYPFVFPKGTAVKISKIINVGSRKFSKNMKGKVGVVSNHRTKNEMRWTRVSVHDEGVYDFLTSELERLNPKIGD